MTALYTNTHRVDEPLCLHGPANSEEDSLHYIKPGKGAINQFRGNSITHTSSQFTLETKDFSSRCSVFSAVIYLGIY